MNLSPQALRSVQNIRHIAVAIPDTTIRRNMLALLLQAAFLCNLRRRYESVKRMGARILWDFRGVPPSHDGMDSVLAEEGGREPIAECTRTQFEAFHDPQIATQPDGRNNGGTAVGAETETFHRTVCRG